MGKPPNQTLTPSKSWRSVNKSSKWSFPGARKWKGGRYGYGQVILASGHLIVSSDSGELALVKAAPEQYSEVARFSALEVKTWNYPAFANGRLLARNATQMAAYDIAVR